MNQNGDTGAEFLQYDSGAISPIRHTLIDEQPVTLSVNGTEWLTFACTPEQVDALAIGFLFNEGIIGEISEIDHIKVCTDASGVDIWLAHAAERPPHWQRTSGCTGGVSAPLPPGVSPLDAVWHITPEAVLAGMAALYQVEGLYQQHRGLHCSALFDGERIRFHAADIGRHNTLDKLAGMWLISGEEIDAPILLTTGRISSEMLHKAARMRCGVVVSRTTPTRLAVRSAQSLRVTLVGYARRDSFVVYSHPQRVQESVVDPRSPQAFEQDQPQAKRESHHR